MISDYGTALINQTEEINLQAARANYVFSMGVVLSKDGDQWCCLLGDNLQVGQSTFHEAPSIAVEKMANYLFTGRES